MIFQLNWCWFQQKNTNSSCYLTISRFLLHPTATSPKVQIDCVEPTVQWKGTFHNIWSLPPAYSCTTSQLRKGIWIRFKILKEYQNSGISKQKKIKLYCFGDNWEGERCGQWLVLRATSCRCVTDFQFGWYKILQRIWGYEVGLPPDWFLTSSMLASFIVLHSNVDDGLAVSGSW